MPEYRKLRQQTLQLLCQFDSGNEDVVSITDDSFDEENSDTSTPDEKALELARIIWANHETADQHIASKTPEWPIHRQPLVDRNILRLARHEILSGMTPPIVAIDEAIELARIFSTEQSAAFVNGVLDTLFHESQLNSDVEEVNDQTSESS